MNEPSSKSLPPNPKTDLSRLSISRDRKDLQAEESGLKLAKLKMPIVLFALLFTVFALGIFLNPSRKPLIDTRETVTVTAGIQNPASLTFFTGQVLNATGYVVAQRKAAVSSKATGRLRAINVVEGDQVKRDQILAVLENEDLQALVKQSEANLELLKSSLDGAQAELDRAKNDNKRAEALKADKVISNAEFDQTNTRFKSVESQLQGAQASILLAQAQLDKAKIDLSYTYIMAPFDGTVLTKNADVGEIVAPFGSSADARAAVVMIADMESLQVEADVSEANIAKVFVGQKTEITLDSFPDKVYHGVVDKIVPTVDRAKATVLTKLKFLDKDQHVLPEMSAKITFLLEDKGL